MKTLIILTLFSLPLIATATQKLECSNELFTHQKIILEHSANTWSVMTEDSLCELNQTEQTSVLLKNWDRFLAEQDENICILNNLVNPQIDRPIVELNISPEIEKEHRGYVQVIVDNSRQVGAPKKIKTFFYCL